MSGGASDVPTDEDCEVLPGNGLLYSGDYSKKTPKKKAGKPPPSLARSPYLSSMNVNPRKASVSAWKLPWTPPCDTPGGETNSARFTSLSNHHDQRSEWDVTSDFPRHTLPTRRHHHHHHHHHHSTPNVARDKEEMHHEMTLLKKSLHEQKSDNQKLKVKLRRLEEDNAKREKQLDELLDPNNSSEYVRSLVDKKPEGSVVMNGLKQRILKLEQQCREKENAIGNLQSELRATNMLEMRMTVKNYYEEIQRLKLLLEASEKSGIFESKVFRKQQKALSSTVLRLSEDVKQLQLDNAALRDELDTESPAAGVKGYKEWSKYRLLRRLLELEERLEERNAPKARNRLEQACQTTPLCFLVHREAQTSPRQLSDVAVQAAAAAAPADTADAATETAAEDDVSDLRTRVERLEAERTQMSRALASKEEEARQTTTRRQEAEEETRRRHADQVGELRAEKEELEKRLERWRAEQTSERELQRRRQRDEVQQLMSERKDEAERWRRQLERERQRHEEQLRQLKTQVENLKDKGNDARQKGQAGAHGDEADADEDDKSDEEEEGQQRLKADAETRQSRRKHKTEAVNFSNPLDGRVLDEVSLVSLQAAFRGHLARMQHLAHSLPKGASSSQLESDTTAAAAQKKLDEEVLWPVSRTRPSLTPPKARPPTDSDDSDDSDDIIVAESYPPRRNREARIV
ncbi:IQ domain-containing protein E isoform X1 [Festucalex cinctus]